MFFHRTTIRKKKLSKRSFTLLEIFNALGLISHCGSVFAVKGRTLWRHYQFQNSVNQLMSELSLIRHLTHTLKADASVRLVSDSKGLHYQMRSDEPYMLKMQKNINRQLFFQDLRIEEPVFIEFTGFTWKSSSPAIVIEGDKNITISLQHDGFATKKHEK